MNIVVGLVSVFVGILICWPLFRYMYKAVSSNSTDFDNGYKKVLKRDATKDFISGSRDSTVDSFVTNNLVVLILPIIPASFLAVPIYFILSWIIGVLSI